MSVMVSWVGFNDSVRGFFEQVTVVSEAPSLWILVVAFVLACAALHPTVWPYARNVITIAHEGGHAVVGRMVGRRVGGVELNADTSGVTVTSGNPRGLGMVFTAAAGYPAPALFGLLGMWGLSYGYVSGVLWGVFVLLAVLMVFIRNLYGAFIVAVTGAAIFGLSYAAPAIIQTLGAYLLVFFLLAGSVRPVWELQAKRRAGEGAESDADQLAGLTFIPGIVWVGVFGVSVVAACVTAAFMVVGLVV